MKTIKAIAFTLMGFALFSCKKEVVMYENPVMDRTFPDPTIIKGGDGLFYAYATQAIDTAGGGMTNIQVAKSEDLVHWEYLGEGLPNKPAWASKTQNFWAPHVIFADNKYYMYFSAEPNAEVKTGDELGLGLGVAVSDSPEGPFIPVDTPMIKGNTFINIDPMAFDDPVTGKKLLYWGSGFEPIKVRELNDDRMSFKQDAPAIELVKAIHFDYQFLVEAAWVTYRNNYYYLYYSGDNCCGDSAHYTVMVARSKNATGPFTVLMKEKEGDFPILDASGDWIAPGHCSIISDDAGVEWMYYHAIDPKQMWSDSLKRNENRRVMMMDPIKYVDEWPMIENNEPSSGSRPAPVLNKK